MVQRPQIRRKHLQQPRFLLNVDHRNLDRAIQPEPVVADALQQADGRPQDVVAGQHAVPVAAAATLDLPGHRQFFPAAQHGNLAHLHQINPHRVVDPIILAGVFHVVFVGQRFVQFVVFRRFGGVLEFFFVGNRLVEGLLDGRLRKIVDRIGSKAAGRLATDRSAHGFRHGILLTPADVDGWGRHVLASTPLLAHARKAHPVPKEPTPSVDNVSGCRDGGCGDWPADRMAGEELAVRFVHRGGPKDVAFWQRQQCRAHSVPSC